MFTHFCKVACGYFCLCYLLCLLHALPTSPVALLLAWLNFFIEWAVPICEDIFQLLVTDFTTVCG
jgi:hypothetical protein